MNAPHKPTAPAPWDKLRDRALYQLSETLEKLAFDWLAASRPAVRPNIDAAVARLLPELVTFVRSLPRESWEQLARLLALFADLERQLPPEALSTLPFLTPEARAALRGRG